MKMFITLEYFEEEFSTLKVEKIKLSSTFDADLLYFVMFCYVRQEPLITMWFGINRYVLS